MELLRNKGQLTRMLILASIVIEKKDMVVSIADHVMITPQGISEYLAAMEMEGLVSRGRRVQSTVSGVEFLERSLLALKGFSDRNIQGLDIVRSTDAIAETAVKKGDKVALTMKRGLLYAGSNGGSSFGIADSDAGANEMVQISALTGVVEMERTPIRLVALPPARSGGGGCRLDPARLREHVANDLGIPPEDMVVAALDMEGAAMLLRCSIPYQLEMPDAETLIGYQERGRHVMAFGTPYSIAVIEDRIAQIRPGGCSERDDLIAPV